MTKYHATVLAATLLLAGASEGFSQTCTQSPAIWTLTAGRTINVGTVTVTNDATNLSVTYDLAYPGATFGTLHLWAGSDLTNLPRSGGGAPVPGRFPYKYDATRMTSYTFTVPLNNLGITDITTACPTTLYVVTHAEVNIDNDGDGTADQDETAFGGDIPGTGSPRWWFYGAYCLTCDFQQEFVCKTAFAKGGYVFVTDRKANPENLPSLNLIRNRWGWAINVTASGTSTYSIWAGAGLNRTSNGKLVGTLTVKWDGSYATVTYNLASPNVMEELHIYAGDFKPTTTAPGQYGNTAYFDPKTGFYTTTIGVSDSNGDGIWIIAHAVSCAPVS